VSLFVDFFGLSSLKYRYNNILGLDYTLVFGAGIHSQAGNKTGTAHASTSFFYIHLKTVHSDRNYEIAPSRVDVLENLTPLPGRSEVDLVAATRFRLQAYSFRAFSMFLINCCLLTLSFDAV
jgi:hypothetical protein